MKRTKRIDHNDQDTLEILLHYLLEQLYYHSFVSEENEKGVVKKLPNDVLDEGGTIRINAQWDREDLQCIIAGLIDEALTFLPKKLTEPGIPCSCPAMYSLACPGHGFFSMQCDQECLKRRPCTSENCIYKE